MNTSFVTRVFLIPSAVFLSVVFGGSYGSGREVVEFVSRHGPMGGLTSLLTICLTYSLCLFLCFELARLHRAYDYRSFFKNLIGRGWFLYEIIVMLGLIISLAVCASAAGSIFNDHFRIPEMLGGLVLLLIVIGLNYLGRDYVERSMIISVGALGLVLVYLLICVFMDHSASLATGFSHSNVDSGAIVGGMQYAFTNGGFIPLLLYCSRGLRSRREVALASGFAAFAAVTPGLAFHLTFMVGYPEILDQRLPTYWLIEQITSPLFLNLYVVLLFVMVAQTGVGLLQGLVERLDNWKGETTGKPLAPSGHALVAGLAVGLSMLLASMGIVTLIIRGYTVLSLSFVLVFFVPLLTYGSYQVWFKRKDLKPVAVAG